MTDRLDLYPEVTVVIPIYNAARFVEDTIRSALAQTYDRLKVIAIDDGSTDASPEILRKLAAELQNLTVRRVRNGGVARARNLGLQMAETELIAFLDADDLWHPTKIEKQVAALMRHSGDMEWAGCYVGYRRIDENGMFLGNRSVHVRSGAFFCSHLVRNHVGNGSGVLVRRDVALKVGGFDPSYADGGIGGCEDWDFQLKVLQRHKMDVVPEFLVGYRIYPGNMSSDQKLMSTSRLAVIGRHASVPHVDPAVRRTALSAAHRAAYPRFWRAGQVAAALRSLTLQLVLDPGAGLVEFRRKLGHQLQRLLPARPGVAERSVDRDPARRTFSSMDPVEDAEAALQAPASPRERWLADMDLAYHARVIRDTRDSNVPHSGAPTELDRKAPG